MGRPILMPLDGVITITPDMIDCTRHFWRAFGHYETETAANYIVSLCQERGGWLPFTQEEIEAHYNKSGYKNFLMYFLVNRDKNGYVIRDEFGKYRVTLDFVCRCYESAPKVV